MSWIAAICRFVAGNLTEEEIRVLAAMAHEGSTVHDIALGQKWSICRHLARMGYAVNTRRSDRGMAMFQRTELGDRALAGLGITGYRPSDPPEHLRMRR